jgi:hypothetical protein
MQELDCSSSDNSVVCPTPPANYAVRAQEWQLEGPMLLDGVEPAVFSTRLP